MHNKKSVFLTGATGLVGSYLLKVLLQNGHSVYALTRGKDNKSAEDRATDVLKFWDEDVLAKNYDSLKVLQGDITEKNLGLNKKTINLLNNEIEEIFHSAAVTQFNWPLEKIRKVNVEGTKNVLNFALRCENLKKVNHVSTAYVCGDYKGVFKEINLDVGQGFQTTYMQSKFEAEKLAEEYRKKGLWVDIFRPPLIIGESKTGRTFIFQQSFYQLLHMWNLGIFDYFPGKGFLLNIVFVDDLCNAIFEISFQTISKNRNYHPFYQKAVSLKTILDISINFLGLKKPELVSRSNFLKKDPTPAQKMLLQNNIFLFNKNVKLDSKMTNGILKQYNFKFSNLNRGFFLNQLKYCMESNFFKRNYERVLH